MTNITFKARENPNQYKKGQLRYEVAMYDGRELAAVTGFASDSKAEAHAAAADMQKDEDDGVTITGLPADDWHALEAGLSTPLAAYYDALPALVAEFGVAEAEARHPWRARQTA